MKMNARLMIAAAIWGALHVAAAGDITGKITLKGTPPAEKDLPLDPNCGKLHPDKKPTTRFYMAGADGGLADVFLSLKGISGKSTGASEKPGVLDQVGCEYVPYVSAMQTKQKLLIRNSDPLLHNVHPTPAVAGNKEFNRAQVPKGADIETTFDNAEPLLRFKCDVHPWMFAYISVVDHPYFAVSGKDGTFKIANVPPGKYTLVAQHRKGGTFEKEIEVTGDGAKADFTIEAK